MRQSGGKDRDLALPLLTQPSPAVSQLGYANMWDMASKALMKLR